MIRSLLSGMVTQLLAIIALSFGATFLVWLVLLFIFFPGAPPRPPRPWPMAYQIEGLARALRSAPPAGRPAIISGSQTREMSLVFVRQPSKCQPTSLIRGARDLQTVLRNRLPGIAITAASCYSKDPLRGIQLDIALGNDTLEIRTGNVGGSMMTNQLAVSVFLMLAVTLMIPWVIARVTGPLRRLAERADIFGLEVTDAIIAEEGSDEIRRVARAFNMMQARIAKSSQDRTRMLAAISHDFRTPLTRMRLQLETKPTELTRANLLRDVKLLQSMVASSLAFLSGGHVEEELEWLDLGALLATLSDEFEEGGANIIYVGPVHLRFYCRPNAITRALTNLMENAVHFGSRTTVAAKEEVGAIVVEVIDDGPGILEGELTHVVEPFVRLDPSRSNRPGSIGLGLSIVKEITEAHRGTFALTNRGEGGLIARLTFPQL